MKILQVTKYFPPAPGGIEYFVGDLSYAFTAEGHENLILAHRYEKSEPEETTGPMGRVVRVPSYGELMYAPIAPSYPAHLRRLLREFKPDILLVHMPNVSGFWPLFMVLPCPLVVYWHADVIFPKEKTLHNLLYKGYSLFEKQLLQKAVRIIPTSKAYLSHSTPLRPFRDKCEVIPLGINTNRIPKLTEADVNEIKKLHFGNSETRYIYAAGRFAHYKGFEILVEAAAIVKATHPDIKFLIAGDGETHRDIFEQIHNSGLEDHIFCPGRITDHEYWALMKGCELFCLPSIERTEAFGMVLLEAMALGKPCISTDIPGSATSWVNKQGETGQVVPFGDFNKLAKVICFLLDSKSTCEHLGQAGISRFKKHFQINQVASDLIDYFETLHGISRV